MHSLEAFMANQPQYQILQDPNRGGEPTSQQEYTTSLYAAREASRAANAEHPSFPAASRAHAEASDLHYEAANRAMRKDDYTHHMDASREHDSGAENYAQMHSSMMHGDPEYRHLGADHDYAKRYWSLPKEDR